MRLIVPFGVCGALVGVAGCNTQSLIPVDGGAARGGSSGTAATSGGNGGNGIRSGSAGGRSGTTGAGGDGTSGFGGDIPTGFGGDLGAGGFIGAGGIIGAAGTVGITGAAGFNRPGVGGIAGHGPSTGGSGGTPPVDASTTTPPEDAGACQCVVGADNVLRMSWDCFTTYFGGGAAKSGWCGGGPGGWVSSCGLDVFKLDRDNSAIPDDEWVYDASGNLVGQQIAEVSPDFVCPTAPAMWPAVSIVAAGQFPRSGCAVTNCTCGDGGAVNCPTPDAGTAINPF